MQAQGAEPFVFSQMNVKSIDKHKAYSFCRVSVVHNPLPTLSIYSLCNAETVTQIQCHAPGHCVQMAPECYAI